MTDVEVLASALGIKEESAIESPLQSHANAREVNASELGRELEHARDEARVLMRVAVVLCRDRGQRDVIPSQVSQTHPGESKSTSRCR